MGLFDKIFKKKEPEVVKVIIPPTNRSEINLNLPDGELVPFEGDILNTASMENIAIFKHNLGVLISKTKSAGKVEKFMLIREDDYFPENWKWRASCSSTVMEEYIFSLSIAIRRAYALEQAGINNKMNGLEIPIDPKTMAKALSNVDVKTGFVYMPSHFRSTKHFTINTPLGVTGSYNTVSTNRNFTIIDSADNFLSSGYGYSLAYYDAYLDVSHEALDISSEAIVLIEKSHFEKMKNDQQLMNMLFQRKVVIYEGDETVAINMLLAQMGALPSQIGSFYAEYDDDLKQIINASIIDLAYRNNLLYNQSHAAYMNPENGHFSNHFDDYNHDHIDFFNEFIAFMQTKFPEHQNLFTISSINDSERSSSIVNAIGTEALLEAIREYNEKALPAFRVRNAVYIKDHDNISFEDHNAILQTVHLISETYSINMEFDTPEKKALLEEAIRRFYQLPTVQDQLEAAKIVWDILGPKLDETAQLEIDTLNI